MPDPMPELISKGPILRALDRQLATTVGCNDLRKAIDSDDDLAKIARNLGICKNKREEDHLRDEWFKAAGETGEKVIRAGLKEALKIAETDPKPIVTYWICHTGHEQMATQFHPDSSDVEVSISWNAHQITVLIHTPPPSFQVRGDLIVNEAISVIKMRDGRPTVVTVKGIP